jgi:hypothetical protein
VQAGIVDPEKHIGAEESGQNLLDEVSAPRQDDLQIDRADYWH